MMRMMAFLDQPCHRDLKNRRIHQIGMCTYTVFYFIFLNMCVFMCVHVF